MSENDEREDPAEKCTIHKIMNATSEEDSGGQASKALKSHDVKLLICLFIYLFNLHNNLSTGCSVRHPD